MDGEQRQRIIEAGVRLLREAEDGTQGGRVRLSAWLATRKEHIGESLEQMHLRARLREVSPQQWTDALKKSRARAATKRIWSAAAIAAGVALLATGVALWQADRGTVYATAPGEFRRVRLVDGSFVSLNSDTRVRVRYSPDAREISLQRGEALFSVTRDAQRPFRVSGGDAVVQALGTEFNVRSSARTTEIMVTGGRVRVFLAPSGEPPGAPTDVLAGNAATLDRPTQRMAVRRITRSERDAALAWSVGAVVFDGVRLDAAVAQFNLHNTKKIVIDEPGLASLKLGGRFQLNEIDAFVEALRPYGIGVRRDAEPEGALHLVRAP